MAETYFDKHKSAGILMNKPNFLRALFVILVILFSCQTNFAQDKKTNLKSNDSTSVAGDSVKNIINKNIPKILHVSSILDSNFASSKISQKNLETTDYRFTEDFLASAQNLFIKKLGNRGMPVDVSLYGLNANSTAFLNDGVNLANRINDYTNLHLFQSESIEEIELLPLSRGFLFGNTNIAAVNFISREPSSSKPYSRLRYYQAPEGEGLIDGIFNISPFKKLKAFIELTNHGADSYYTNSRFSNWMASVRLSYLLSPTETIKIDYKHVKANTGLNGGVDLAATGKKYPNFLLDDLVYDNLTAVVRFPNRYITNTNNFFAAALLTKAITGIPAEISFYYRDDLTEFRQNISGTITENVLPVSHDNKAETFGGRVRLDYSTGLFEFQSISNAERTKINSPLFEKGITQTSFSSYGLLTLKSADKIFLPSAYVKYLNLSQRSFFGFGADAIINLTDKYSLFAGLSHFEKPLNQLTQKYFLGALLEKSQQGQTAEFKASADFDILKISAGYFLINNSNDLSASFIATEKLNDNAYYIDSYKSTVQGFSLQASFNFWKIHLITNSTVYLDEKEQLKKGLPNFSSNGGIYYIDTLFNQNLKMKAGFNYYSTGSRYEQRFDFEKGISSSYFFDTANGSISLINSTKFTPSFRLDFFFAGRIQESAVVYFAWENLFNSRFFDVPLYPAAPRGLRFGVAWEFLD